MLLLLNHCLLFAQDVKPLALKVQTEKNKNTEFTRVKDILEKSENRALSSELKKGVANSEIFNYNKSLGAQIISEKYPAIKFDIVMDGTVQTLEMVAVKSPSRDYIMTTASGKTNNSTGSSSMHYRGIVADHENSSLAVLSVFEDELIGIVSMQDKGNYVIGKTKGSDMHVMYNETNLIEPFNFNCQIDALGEDLDEIDHSKEISKSTSNTARTDVDDIVINVYFEVDNEIFKELGSSVSNTENFVTGLFNQVSAIYANDGINLAISEIFVWDRDDPYSDNNVGFALTEFNENRNDFNGDLAQLLEYNAAGSGLAAGIGGVCASNSRFGPHTVSSINPVYNQFPTYSRQVKVVAHEFGHTLGAHHTHQCRWNGDNTSIDDYGNYNNRGILNPRGQGVSCVDLDNPKLDVTPTIMSYYDTSRNGSFPLSNGFGDQVGERIRETIAAASCLSTGTPPLPPPTGLSCGTTIDSFPYTESFESGLGAWDQESGDDFDWTRQSGGTPSNTTGPAGANDGRFYLYTEASNPNNPSKRAVLSSPCFDLGGTRNPEMNFAYQMSGTQVGSLTLEASTNGSNWTSIWSRAGDQGNAWRDASVDVSDYTASDVKFRFNVVTGDGFRGDIAIDNVSVTSGETIPPPPSIFPDPDKLYYIDSPSFDLRVAADGSANDPYTTSTNTTGADVEWKFVAKGNLWHIQRAAGGERSRLRSRNRADADMQATSSSGNWTTFEPTTGRSSGTYFLTLPNGPGNFVRLQVNSSGDVKMVPASSSGGWESFLITEVPFNDVSLVSDIEDEDLSLESTKILIFPNPVATTMNVQLPTEGEEVVLSVVSLTGKTVRENSFQTHNGLNLLKVDMHGLTPGLYLLNILRNNVAITKKILVE